MWVSEILWCDSCQSRTKFRGRIFSVTIDVIFKILFHGAMATHGQASLTKKENYGAMETHGYYTSFNTKQIV
jgi:hypothetical protein